MSDSKRTIPLIFHQTWKTRRLPRRFRNFRQTWIKHHPDAEYKLWTDKNNRDFLEQHYAWFLPTYDAYPQKIMRIDAIRYFLLKHFGGIYIDLDFECLAPITPLLSKGAIIIGCEPPSHFQVFAKTVGENRLCNAFMASVAGHPFWDHTIDLLIQQREAKQELTPSGQVLVRTGPVFLSQSYQTYTNKSDIHIESHKSLYPINVEESRKPRYTWQLNDALAIHHWQGSWWRWQQGLLNYRTKFISIIKMPYRILKPSMWLSFAKRYARLVYLLVKPNENWRYFLYWNFSIPSKLDVGQPTNSNRQLWIKKLIHGKSMFHAVVDRDIANELLTNRTYPKISCLMVTRERFHLAQRAIRCFLNQTYPNKELIIIDDGPDQRLEKWANSLNNDNLLYVRLPDEKKPLGELRNISLQHASGEYIAQWDDDDIIHPDKLLLQLEAMVMLGVKASFLHRQLIWMPSQHLLGISEYKLLENTLVCDKKLLPAYPSSQRKGEDTPVCQALTQSSEIALIDQPEAYIYVSQDHNTWDKKHFAAQWNNCSHQYTSDFYQHKLDQLSSDYGIEFEIKDSAYPNLEPVITPPPSDDIQLPQNLPSILVLTPAKNAARHIHRFLDNLEKTQYPAEKISLAFLESDSDDGTDKMIEKELPRLRERYARAELHKRDFGYQIKGQRWAINKQRQRRSILAKSRNTLLFNSLRDEEWVFWIDVDLDTWPSDAFIQLLNSGKNIVVPHCIRKDGTTFDLNTFALSEDAANLDWQRYLIDGILQPPMGYGRRYLGQLQEQEYVELDAVGATMLLVRADIHREGLIFPPQPYNYYIETEGLAQMAIDMGYICWGMPKLEIVHVDY